MKSFIFLFGLCYFVYAVSSFSTVGLLGTLIFVVAFTIFTKRSMDRDPKVSQNINEPWGIAILASFLFFGYFSFFFDIFSWIIP